MKQQRFVPFTPLAGVVVAVLITVVVACGNSDGGSSTGARPALGGEEIFRGLVFHEGAVAALFPELGNSMPPRKLTPEQRDARERARARVVADMRQADASFFDRFGAAIQSGDHLRIEQTMHESAELLKRVTRRQTSAAPAPDERHGTCILLTEIEVEITVSDCYDYCPGGGENIEWVLSSESIVAVLSPDIDFSIADDDSGEGGWGGTRLGRDQLTELIAARLATK